MSGIGQSFPFSGTEKPLFQSWNNSAVQNSGGLCEAAVATWLERIGTSGVEMGQKLKPKDCDERQNVIEGKVKGKSWNFAVDLLGLLPRKSEFNTGNALLIIQPENKDDSSPREKRSKLDHLLNGMKAGTFYFISANEDTFVRPGDENQSHIAAHAMAVNCEAEGELRFFDPNNGFYSGFTAQILTRMNTTFSGWSRVTLSGGRMRGREERAGRQEPGGERGATLY